MKFLAALCLSLLWLLLFPDSVRAQAASWHLVTRNHRDYLPLSDFCAFYGYPAPSGSDGRHLTVHGKAGDIVFEADSTRIILNGICHDLSFPILAEEESWYVSRIDLAYFFEPLLRPAKIGSRRPFKGVIIDPGHGGADNGAYSTRGGMEKTYTLDTAFRLEKVLQAKNVTSVLTRRQDEFIPLEERAHFGDRYPDFLFVSIHFNSAGRGARGLETYAETPRGASSTSSEGNLHQSDFENVPGNETNPYNILLAASIHRRIITDLNPGDTEADRGVKRARFVVLKENSLPATLVEGGFLTNPLESNLIDRPEYRQRLAEGIAKGIGDFLKQINDPLAAAFRDGKPALPEPPPPRAVAVPQPAAAPNPPPAAAVPAAPPKATPVQPYPTLQSIPTAPAAPDISTTPPPASLSPAPAPSAPADTGTPAQPESTQAQP